MANKVALVTGASRGIGKAIALKLAEAGMDIAIVYAGNTAAAEQCQKEVEALGVRAKTYQCDVSDFSAAGELVSSVTADFGPIWALVNNAGITKDTLCMRMKEEEFDRVIAVNLKGAFNLIRQACGGMMRSRAGRIINLTSVVGLMGNAGQANYAAAKAGLIGLTKSVAKELASRGVTCNAIAPGFIETDMTAAMPAAAQEAVLSAIPMKRCGQAEDVANLAAFLACEQAGYLTGAVIPVDGGMSM